jgi:putative peptide zinc metalloprotease protein
MPLCETDLASRSRALPLLVRRDLVIVSQPTQRGTRSTVKDPVARRYWRLSEEETFLLQSLDGAVSARELCDRFGRRFAPRRLTAERLTVFLARLHEQGLVVVHRPGQAEVIHERQRQWRRGAPLRALEQLLAWRFRGIDPDRWLARVAPRLSFIFTSWTAGLFALLLVSAIALVVTHWTRLDRELATFQGSFSAEQALLVLATVGLVKVLHELAHAIACKTFGGECHEIGVMLLVGMPSLYCDVSDAWMLSDKWRRILTSAAGILVELAIAAVAAWLWWYTHPGLVHSLALYALVVCSLNTLLLNGNPLLQYDGYYVLSDLTDTPNLRAQGRVAALGFLARIFLGKRLTADDGQRRGTWLVAYGFTSAIYRALVVLGIAWFLHGLLEPYGAQLFSWMIGGLMLIGLVSRPTQELVRFLRRPGWERDIPWRVASWRTGLLGMLCSCLMLVPLPASVVAPVVLEPRGMRPVYVEVAGRLAWAIAPGSRVERGDVLARLENLPLARELEQLAGERDAMRLRLTMMRRRQGDPEAAAQIPTTEKALADVEERLRQRQRDLDRLVIRAPRAGIVLPPEKRDDEDHPVATWTGTPLDVQNLGCELRSGDVLCVIGEPQTMDAIVFVAQGDDELVHAGQSAELLVDAFPQRLVTGAVIAPATARAVEPPQELILRGELPIEQDQHGQTRARESLFTARIEVAPQDQPLLIGGTGRARIEVAPRSLAGRLWRNLGQTLREP